MENKVFKFRTNLNCSGCVSKMKSDFDNEKSISEWNVDTENKDKILTVKTSDLTEEDIIDMVNEKGFEAEVLK